MAKRFESFLNRLDIEGSIIPLDWDCHMDWYWQSYSKRVKDAECKRALLATTEVKDQGSVFNEVSVLVARTEEEH